MRGLCAGNPQRVHMAAPTAKVGLSQGRMVRNSNKHKRLFDPDEPNGVKVHLRFWVPILADSPANARAFLDGGSHVADG